MDIETPRKLSANGPAPTTIQFVLHRNIKTVQRLRSARERGLEAWTKKTKADDDGMGERRIRGGMRRLHEIGRIATHNLLKIRKEGDGRNHTLELYNSGPRRPVEVRGFWEGYASVRRSILRPPP